MFPSLLSQATVNDRHLTSVGLKVVRGLPVPPRAGMELTRKEVGARLRRSVATVRRLEGHVLHPRRDAQGIHWFSVEEVERLCRTPEHRRPDARSSWLKARLRSRHVERQESDTTRGGHARAEADAIADVLRAAEHVLDAAVPLHHQDCVSVPLTALEELAAALDAV